MWVLDKITSEMGDDSPTRKGTSLLELTGGQKLLIVMVGLPARGKSFIAHRLTNYLTWYGLDTRVFNVGAYRRMVGGKEDAEFFDAANAEGAARREELAWTVLNKLLDWLKYSGGDVGVFDATNTTDERRRNVLKHAKDYFVEDELNVLFIESVCDDPKVLVANLEHKIARSPDFVGVPRDQALLEFKARIAKYERVYRTIADDSLSYIKVMNLSSKIVCNKIHGRSQYRIVAFLMSLHVVERPVWLVRAGPVDTDPSYWGGSWHPGVVAHQLKSPGSTPGASYMPDPYNIVDSRGHHYAPHNLQTVPPMSLDTANDTVMTLVKTGGGAQRAYKGGLERTRKPSVRKMHEAKGVESPTVSEGNDDDYWTSFKGTASWQRKPSNDDLYSWGGGSARNADLRAASSKDTAHSTGGGFSPYDNALNLQLPEPSALGAGLNADGRNIAVRLGRLLAEQCVEWGKGSPYIFSSTLPRAVECAQVCAAECEGAKIESCSALNPVDVGACHGLTLRAIREKLGTTLLEQMRKNPYEARLPGGESQQDVTKRLEPFIVDCLERQTAPVIIISHLSTLQILYDYFLGTGGVDRDPFWALSMPPGSVIQLTPRFGGAGAGVSWEQTRIDL